MSTYSALGRSSEGPILVLLVDDDPDFLDLSATFLEREDDRFETRTATSAGDALTMLTATDFDCVVSDYDMPGRNGIDFLEAVRAACPGLPFVLFTGKGSEEVASDAISAGVTEYLQKETGTGQYAVLANRIANAVERYRATCAVERAEEKLSQVAEKTDDVLFMFDADWDELLFINSAYEDIWGAPIADLEATPESFLDTIHPEDRPSVRRSMERLSNGEPDEVKYRVVRPDGERRWVHVESKPIFGEDGSVIRIVGFARDVTDRTRRERDLEQARTEYAELIDGMNDTAWVIDTDGRFLAVNDAAMASVGYSRAELLSMRPHDIDAGLDAAEITALIEGISDDGIQVFETVHETKSGERIPVEISSSLISYRGETAILSIGRDISGRLGREKQMRRLHEATRNLLAAETSAEVAQIAAEASKNVLEYPNTVVRLANDDRTELHALGITETAREELGERPVYPVGDGTAGEAYARGEPIIYDDVTERDDGYERGWGRAAMYLPIGEYGTISISDTDVGVFDETDINIAQILAANTETALQRIERERQLSQRNEQLEEFAAIVSHDLRNPLNVAQGRIELARLECDSDHLDAAADALTRSFALIENLLTLAQQGKRVDAVEPVDLRAVVDRAWRSVETVDATLAVETDRPIRADANRLQALLENLFRNAVEHGGEAVTVTVGDLADGFYVADDGPGIPDDERGRVFESGVSTLAAGTGLGLDIVRGIADAHGWESAVTDGAAGGARFEFTGVALADADLVVDSNS